MLVLATLTLHYIDQPWFRCHFAAGPAWDAIRPTIEEWTQATLEREAPDVLRIPRAWEAVKDLGMTLVPLDGTAPIEDFLIPIDGATARFRY
ncbi:hypothetical protein TUSST3_23970 [Streptomyces sp. TUS-ST3]|uniref:hypothetical protein n=1 Tax=Streptomyces sp. TUS-ST3 TaxID=3025591 RepID=UPI00235B4951|nr:hypothetical protein [Streptomyces sp. TUS-ST3]GLP65777.1 hypothetical protein TUSST3_23970 [Streptomyces sp. TUS-ST3]